MDTVISSQPITCEVSASSASQPSVGHALPRWKSCQANPSTTAPAVAPAVASNSGAATAAPAPGDEVAWRSIRM